MLEQNCVHSVHKHFHRTQGYQDGLLLQDGLRIVSPAHDAVRTDPLSSLILEHPKSVITRCPCVRPHPVTWGRTIPSTAEGKGSAQASRDLRVDEDVLRLEVAVHDAPPVQLREGQHDFARVQGIGVGIEGRVMLQKIKELATGEIIHDEI